MPFILDAVPVVTALYKSAINLASSVAETSTLWSAVALVGLGIDST